MCLHSCLTGESLKPGRVNVWARCPGPGRSSLCVHDDAAANAACICELCPLDRNASYLLLGSLIFVYCFCFKSLFSPLFVKMDEESAMRQVCALWWSEGSVTGACVHCSNDGVSSWLPAPSHLHNPRPRAELYNTIVVLYNLCNTIYFNSRQLAR